MTTRTAVVLFSVMTAIALRAQVPDVTVTILKPAPDDVVVGPVTLAADVRANVAVKAVTFFADGIQACVVRTAPYQCEWEAPASGARDIRVVAELNDGTRMAVARRTRGVLAPFRSSADSVLVPVRVRDHQRRYVRGLDGTSFRVFEDDVPQTVLTFGSEAAGGDVLLALDASGSMTPALDELRAAARAFLAALPIADRVTVAAFNTTLGVLAPRTSTPVARVAALGRLAAGGDTAIYDVLIQAIDVFPASSERRAIVMFTDGEDVASRASLATARARLLSANVVVFFIAQGRAANDPRVRGQLGRLAAETGGEAFFAPRMSQVKDHFTEIAEELSNQYVLGYVPSRPAGDGQWRTIRVELADPSRQYQVTARQGYVAERSPSNR